MSHLHGWPNCIENAISLFLHYGLENVTAAEGILVALLWLYYLILIVVDVLSSLLLGILLNARTPPSDYSLKRRERLLGLNAEERSLIVVVVIVSHHI